MNASKRIRKTLQKHLILVSFTVFFFCFKSFAQPLASYNFGDGITFISDNEQFSLNTKTRVQSLYFVSSALGHNFLVDMESGASVRRARLKFDGQINSQIEFKFEFGFSNRDMGLIMAETNGTASVVLDALLKYNLTQNTQIWFGQTKLPGNRERITSSQTLQFVDRSLLNSYFNIDRDIGIQLRHSWVMGKNFVVKEIASICQGEGRNITIPNFGGYDYTFRLEILPFGEFSKKGDYTESAINFVRGEKNQDDGKLAIAASYDFNHKTARSAGQLGSFVFDTIGQYSKANIKTVFIDAMYKYRRISVMAEYAYKKSKAINSFYSDQYFSGWSYNHQMGCMLSSKTEIALRHTYLYGNKSGVLTMFTLGFSRYVHKHNLKFQTDFSISSKEGQNPNALFRFQTEIAF